MASLQRRLFSFAPLSAVLLIAPLILPAIAEEPAKATPPENTPRWPRYPYQVGAGVQGLASFSTDIVVADVVRTAPRHAIEGARDNLKLKVVRVLLGGTVPGETIDVYYHLLWTDMNAQTLEPLKFEDGKRYFVFLKSHRSTDGENKPRLEYELSDQWLSVMKEEPGRMTSQEDEINGAVRIAYGDACGEWSKPTETSHPLVGRLLAYREESGSNTPYISIYLDLDSPGGSRALFDLGRVKLTWTLTDETGKVVAPTDTPILEKMLLAQRVVVSGDKKTRLQVSTAEGEVPKDRSGYLCLVPGKTWVFERGDKHSYFLTGHIEVHDDDPRNGWTGALDLPKVQVPID